MRGYMQNKVDNDAWQAQEQDKKGREKRAKPQVTKTNGQTDGQADGDKAGTKRAQNEHKTNGKQTQNRGKICWGLYTDTRVGISNTDFCRKKGGREI